MCSDDTLNAQSADDHDGGSAGGVAYGHDPSGGELDLQFGSLWVCLFFSTLLRAVSRSPWLGARERNSWHGIHTFTLSMAIPLSD
jgi:hypothetical protein